MARPAMKKSLSTALTAAILMLFAAGIAYALTPRQHIADTTAKIDYETVIPKSFGDWVEAPAYSNQVVNPQQQAQLEQLYTQMVARTFIHQPTGRRVMLSLAYGRDQSRENQVHKPEVCYPAQGFQIKKIYKDAVVGAPNPIPVMRLHTSHGPRIEPVTYWIRVGDKLVRGAIEQNIARVGFGLNGQIPDGLLFRVSEINGDLDASFRIQDEFIVDLLAALGPTDRAALVGNGH
jgi:EpsI family protein